MTQDLSNLQADVPAGAYGGIYLVSHGTGERNPGQGSQGGIEFLKGEVIVAPEEREIAQILIAQVEESFMSPDGYLRKMNLR